MISQTRENVEKFKDKLFEKWWFS